MSGRRTSPTPAERARTLLAAGGSATALWDAFSPRYAEVPEGIAADGEGDLVLALPVRHPLAQAVLGEQGGELATALEFTDLVATQARDRVRARLSVAGHLTVRLAAGPDEPLALRLDVAEVVLEDAAGAWAVDLEEYRAAAPDCLAGSEPDRLLHLAGRHADAVELLARLVPARALQGAVRVLPVTIDRYGLVLRVERARGHADVRLPFRTRLDSAADAARELHLLMAEAGRAAACRQDLSRDAGT